MLAPYGTLADASTSVHKCVGAFLLSIARFQIMQGKWHGKNSFHQLLLILGHLVLDKMIIKTKIKLEN
jgi:hypothetical protein